MNHYYTPEPDSPHKISIIQFQVKGVSLRFKTDAGVFSRQKVDYGSNMLIETLPPLRGTVLDLGCGYGPIGISLAALNPEAVVTLVEVNQRAVSLARENILLNQVANAAVCQGDGFSPLSGRFQTIVTNPPIRAGKRVIYPLLEESLQRLEPGGSLWLVVQKKQGAASMLTKLEEVFGGCTVVNKRGGYWILTGKAPLPN